MNRGRPICFGVLCLQRGTLLASMRRDGPAEAIICYCLVTRRLRYPSNWLARWEETRVNLLTFEIMIIIEEVVES